MFNRNRYIIFYIFTIGAFASCNQSLIPGEFISEMSKNPSLNKRYENKTFHLSCSYRPSAFLAISELQRNDSAHVSQEMFNERMKHFDHGLYFEFSIGLNNDQNIATYNLANQEEYARLLSELTYNMGKDLYLVMQNKDTVRPLTYNYSNDYGMGRDARFLFVFPENTVLKNIRTVDVVYNDRVFGVGEIVRFQFNSHDLVNQPSNIKFTAS